jgi:hypothetical protein
VSDNRVPRPRIAGVHVDARIARIATLQDGVMGRDQLVPAGLGRGAIRHRVATGEFTRLFRGVYAIGRTTVTPRGGLEPRCSPSGRTPC